MKISIIKIRDTHSAMYLLSLANCRGRVFWHWLFAFLKASSCFEGCQINLIGHFNLDVQLVGNPTLIDIEFLQLKETISWSPLTWNEGIQSNSVITSRLDHGFNELKEQNFCGSNWLRSYTNLHIHGYSDVNKFDLIGPVEFVIIEFDCIYILI